ncbi:MAG: SufE family protein, partial [Campylobacteraceae bacterium]|nr:SufE family protein [Campylobacteraceae bacterium]
MSIEQRVFQIREDLELFDNDLDKYEYIIDLGKTLAPLDPDQEKDENLVQGCTSKVWLICEKKEKKLYFKANSNAMIVKGLVYILISIFSNLSAKEILDINLDVLKKLDLAEIITPNRQSG